MTVADDHADDQPSAHSLTFSGSKDPGRGTYLHTADGAPLNTNQFKSGYTIEAFIKLPAGCCGSHAWMGLLGQMGTGADLGRTMNDPLEGSIELALSDGGELQWAIWPTNRLDNTTAWGHLITPQQWVEVAVVNDGRFTDLYINGSLMGRNPFSPAIGIGTDGRPWTLRAIDYNNAYEQTSNGQVGDVRIVDHALAPSQFMDAARDPQPAARPTAARLNTDRSIDVTVNGATASGTLRASAVEPHTGARVELGQQRLAPTVHFTLAQTDYVKLQDGARVEVTVNGTEHDNLHLDAQAKATDAPVTTAMLSPAPLGDGSYVAPTVTLTGVDAAGNPVASTRYRIDGGDWTAYASPFTVAAPGAHTVEFRSTDVRGNAETARSIAFTVYTAATDAGAAVPATLALSLGAAPGFGAFTPGVEKTYTASTTATVISSAGDATLAVADPSTTASAHLVNGTFALDEPLGGLGTVATFNASVSNAITPVAFSQHIAATQSLRTGSYQKRLVFTLSTSAP